MTRDRPWLWLGRNAFWIVVPLTLLLLFARDPDSESAGSWWFGLLWLGPFVGLGVVWVKYLLWRERRHETPAERATREAAKELQGDVGSAIGAVLWTLGQIVLAFGVVYVVLHFVVKYW